MTTFESREPPRVKYFFPDVRLGAVPLDIRHPSDDVLERKR